MIEPTARLYLVSPLLTEPAAFAPCLAAACAAGDIAAVLLRFAATDERSLVNGVKALAPGAQERGAAVVVAAEGEADLATVAARGGADGVHATGDPSRLGGLRQRLRDERILGAGGLRSRDDAMTAGEAGADYLLFGEPRPDGSLLPLAAVAERAAWWADIFETPCVAYAPSLDAVAVLAATGAEFVALGEAVWNHPEGPAAAVAAALRALPARESAG